MIHNTARLPLPALISPGAADDLRSGKQLVGADGSIVTGTLPEVIQATPTISVSSGGLITASATQSGGIVEGGTKSSTKQLTTQAAKTVTPGTTNQTAVASGRYTTGAVTVKGDSNLKAENIAEGVSIFGVTGKHSGGGETVVGTIRATSMSAYINLVVYTMPAGAQWATGAPTITGVEILKGTAVYINTTRSISVSGGLTEVSRPANIGDTEHLYTVTDDFTILVS